jgi:hypothetical protein
MVSAGLAFALGVVGTGLLLSAAALWQYRTAGPDRSTYLFAWLALLWVGFGLFDLADAAAVGESVHLVVRIGATVVVVSSLGAAYRAYRASDESPGE